MGKLSETWDRNSRGIPIYGHLAWHQVVWLEELCPELTVQQLEELPHQITLALYSEILGYGSKRLELKQLDETIVEAWRSIPKLGYASAEAALRKTVGSGFDDAVELGQQYLYPFDESLQESVVGEIMGDFGSLVATDERYTHIVESALRGFLFAITADAPENSRLVSGVDRRKAAEVLKDYRRAS